MLFCDNFRTIATTTTTSTSTSNIFIFCLDLTGLFYCSNSRTGRIDGAQFLQAGCTP